MSKILQGAKFCQKCDGTILPIWILYEFCRTGKRVRSCLLTIHYKWKSLFTVNLRLLGLILSPCPTIWKRLLNWFRDLCSCYYSFRCFSSDCGTHPWATAPRLHLLQRLRLLCRLGNFRCCCRHLHRLQLMRSRRRCCRRRSSEYCRSTSSTCRRLRRSCPPTRPMTAGSRRRRRQMKPATSNDFSATLVVSIGDGAG